MAPETRDSLLIDIRESANREAWCEFVEIYQPVIYRLVRQSGVQDADACDLTQEILLKITYHIKDWQPGHAYGSFRGWLSTVARNLLITRLRQQSRRAEQSEGLDFRLQDQLAANQPELFDFDQEAARATFRLAAVRVQSQVEPSTWSAFQLVTLDGISIKQAAES